MPEFRRDRLTWIAYSMLGWFALLQAAPGLVIPHLRDELHLSYGAGGLHVAAFAAGSLIAGFSSGPLERELGRRRLFWSSIAVLGAGAVLLLVARIEALTLTSMLVMGFAGGLVLVTVQALLADHHGANRTIALTEANVAASVAYVVLIGSLGLASALHVGWRAAIVSILILAPIAYAVGRREPIEAPARNATGAKHDRATLPPAFWVAAAMMFCTTAAEWCINGWGASFVKHAVQTDTDTAVTVMGAYFAGVLIGRTGGSALARRFPPHRLLAGALVITAAGFAVMWPATTELSAAAGLLILGLGLGNLFPLGLSITVGLAPGHAQLASSRAVLVTSSAVLIAPLTVGALADATSITDALGVIPVMLALAAVGLAAVTRAQTRAARPLPA